MSSNKKKIILVANNKAIKPINLSLHKQVSRDDLIVRMGKSYMVAGDRTDIYFIRAQARGYTGIDRSNWLIKPEIRASGNVRYYAAGANQYLDWIVNTNKIHISEIVNPIIASRKHQLESPSTGLVVLEYLLARYPHKDYQIYIHNFSWQGWSGYNWSKEQAILEIT